MNIQRYGVIPDMTYGHDKFGPVQAGTVLPHYVQAEHFDRVTAERDQLHVRLTEAEQKADDLLTQLNLSTQRVRDLTEGNGALRVRIANLERGLAGMLHALDNVANDGRAGWLQAMDFARTLVKPAQYRPSIDDHPDLHSRPEERGTPETEPCSGCGVPGWTASCDKCIPY